MRCLKYGGLNITLHNRDNKILTDCQAEEDLEKVKDCNMAKNLMYIYAFLLIHAFSLLFILSYLTNLSGSYCLKSLSLSIYIDSC